MRLRLVEMTRKEELSRDDNRGGRDDNYGYMVISAEP